MKKLPDVFISQKLWVKESLVSDDLKSKFYVQLFNEKLCKPNCPFYEDRPCAACDRCQAYQGLIKLYKEKKIQGKNYIGFSTNNPNTVKKMGFGDYWKIPNLRKKIQFSTDIKFTGKLRDGSFDKETGLVTADQVGITSEWLKHKLGIIECPARSGKSIMGVFISCKLGLKTVFMAHRKELITQMYGNFKQFSNVKDKNIKIVEKSQDLQNLSDDIDILLVNYQKFFDRKDGTKKLAKYLNDKFSLLIVDECHHGAAVGYCKIIMQGKFRYILGLTATPKRKDSLNKLVGQTVGPVVARGVPTSLAPQIIPVLTGVQTNYARTYMSIIKALCQSKVRQNIICKLLEKDLKEGRQVIIPLATVNSMPKLRDRIYEYFNKLDYYPTLKNGEPDWVGIFNATNAKGKAREEILSKFDSGYYKILIANWNMIDEGINFKSKNIDTIYMVMPISASSDAKAGSPKFYQTTYRVCSPVSGKKQPIVRWFIDDCGLSIGCARSTFYKEIVPRLKEFDGMPPRYKMSKEDAQTINDITRTNHYSQ